MSTKKNAQQQEAQQPQESDFIKAVHAKGEELSKLIGEKSRGYIILAYDENDEVTTCVEGEQRELAKSLACSINESEQPLQRLVLTAISLVRLRNSTQG